MLAITKLSAVQHRMAISKMIFWLKLAQQEVTTWPQHKQRSLATKVFTEIKSGFAVRTQHTKGLPQNTEVRNFLTKVLTQGDSNLYWHARRHCTNCNVSSMKCIKLQKVLECNKHKQRHKHNFDSIMTELSFPRKKFYGSD